MRQQLSGDSTVQSVTINVSYSDVFHSLVFLPVYITQYKYSSSTFKVFISAQTGTVSAERPFGLGTAGGLINKVRSWFVSN